MRVSRLLLASEALSDRALTRRDLQRDFRKIHNNVYAPKDMELTARDRTVAAWLWSDRAATVSGLSAAVLLGSRWVPDDTPAEIVRTQYPAPIGITVHQDRIADDELTIVSGISCTTVARTGFDLGRRLPFLEGLIHVDALLNATRAPVAGIADIASRYSGARHVRRLREVLEIADGGAESPPESKVRLVLIRGGLPRPITQIPVGRRRVDMGWPEWKVGVEYDGQQHWNDPRQHGVDIARLEEFQERGWRIVRVVAEHLRSPESIVHRAELALRAAGWADPLTPSRIGLLTPRPGRTR